MKRPNLPRAWAARPSLVTPALIARLRTSSGLREAIVVHPEQLAELLRLGLVDRHGRLDRERLAELEPS